MALLQAITHGFVQQSHTALRVLRKLRRLSWFSAALRSPPSGPLLAAAQPTLVGSLTSFRFRSVTLHCACQAHRTIPIHWQASLAPLSLQLQSAVAALQDRQACIHRASTTFLCAAGWPPSAAGLYPPAFGQSLC
jgi:hypothetical protein